MRTVSVIVIAILNSLWQSGVLAALVWLALAGLRLVSFTPAGGATVVPRAFSGGVIAVAGGVMGRTPESTSPGLHQPA